jgi:TonB-linked SusC/RagA family outer membrane protein
MKKRTRGYHSYQNNSAWLLIGIISFCCGNSFAQSFASIVTDQDGLLKKQERYEFKPLKDVLADLEHTYGARFGFESKIIEGKLVDKRLLKDYEGAGLNATLRTILDSLKLDFERLNDNNYVIYADESGGNRKVNTKKRPLTLPKANDNNPTAAKGKQQPGFPGPMKDEDVSISGRVTSAADGEPLPGVSILVKGTATGTVTDVSGNYAVVAPEDGTLVFSFVGFSTTEVPINGQTVINVSMTAESKALDEIVVIGYGQQERSRITGAISTVNVDELSGVTSGGIQEALQGRVAGVNITPTSGMPGGALDMNVRGVATFGNGNPLFVIDGVPILTEESSRNFNPLASLNPENIKSIQILKDASASAIYGARAANGVVIITTNRGSEGETKIQVRSSIGVSEVTKLLPMMSTAQWIPYSTEAYVNAGRPIPVAFEEPLLSQNLQRNTDWQREGFSPATVQNYWLGVSGGTQTANYAFSAGYLDQEGTLPTSGFKRYSARINSDFQVGNKLKIGETVEFSQAEWTGTFSQTGATMRQLLQQAPTVPVYNPDNLGGFDGPRLEYGPVGRQNSIGHLTLDGTNLTQSKVLGNAYIEYEIIPGLTNRFNVGGEITFGETVQFLPRFEMGDRVRTVAILNEGTRNESAYLVEDVLTFQRKFNDVHDLTILAGFTQQHSWAKSINVQVRNFPNDDLRTIAAAFEERDISGNETGWALRSQIGRINYTFNDKYNVMAAIRRDGSSRFGKNNRYGVFPSVSASWIISRESFLNEVEQLSNLTLRISRGKVGSQDIDNFATYATVEQGQNYVFGAGEELIAGSTYLSLGNSDLKWEVTTQTNVGLDVGLFDNKLSLVMDYYIKDTDDILLQLPIPTTSGIRRDNGAFVNAGSMRNKGFEFSADYQNTLWGDLKYSIGGNISTNTNEVTYLRGGLPIIASRASGKQTSLTITQVGSPIGSFYGYIMDGIFMDQPDVDNHAQQSGSAPGDVKFRDLNADGIINADDQTIIGNPFPDFVYGLNLNLLYKNFDLVVFVHGKQGHNIYNHVWADLNEGEGDNNQTTELLNRWTPDNRNTDIPRAITGNPGQNTRPSTRFIEDASFLRIQNIQLGYNVSPELAERLNIDRLRLYVAAKNLATFTDYRGYNPEIGKLDEGSRSSLTRGIDHAMYPIPRTIEAGVQIDF